MGKCSRLWIVKVGGSLYTLPDLAERLRGWLTANVPADGAAVLVPGGGSLADVVRDLDARHGLGEERAHFLALRVLSLNAHFLACLLPEAALLDSPGHRPGVRQRSWWILDSHAFVVADEASTGQALLPHCWDATSDSVAARVAVVWHAERLVLLKSVTVPAEVNWDEASRLGLVDPVFPRILQQAGRPLEVQAINLKEWQQPSRR